MVDHIVLFKLKPEATDEQVDAMIDGLRGLKATIETVVELTCGRNFSDRAQGHQVALRVVFNDRAGLDFYAPHPLHQGVVTNLVKPILVSTLAVDFEY